MSRRVDFSHNADAYDRRHGAVLSAGLARSLAEAAHLGPGLRILDIGAGTGRVAIALAALGCDVVAVDPAQPMLRVLRTKIRSFVRRIPLAPAVAAGRRRRQPDRAPVHLVAGEGARLPFADSAFDAAILARTLYLMPDWRDVLNDIIRALKNEGQILHEWGNGTADDEWVQIREKTRALFEEAGVADPFHPGARSESDVDEFLAGRGFSVQRQIRVDGDVCLTLAEFMGRLIDGECSYTWDVPAEVQRVCLPRLEKWVAENFVLDRPLPIPREFSWTIYQRSA
jgi:ubiquinone/menaquinone biosynthesis C-methylase UbiE